ncbi:MAG: metal-dependent hydrolase [Pseudomonadota bacterium]
MMIGSDTLVLYTEGCLEAQSRCVHAVRYNADGVLLFFETTPFHPVDHKWPDQPSDQGEIEIGGDKYDVLNCMIAARESEASDILVGDEIPVRTGTDGWAFFVAHEITSANAPETFVGLSAYLRVNEDRRIHLSQSHTACHLAALALNAAATEYWKKEFRLDSLGHPDFDQAAIQSSQIFMNGSTDVYRLGKGMKKKGFNNVSFLENLPKIQKNIQDYFDKLVALDAEIYIEKSSPKLSDRRVWHAIIDGETAAIPCGGTHASSTGIGDYNIKLIIADEGLVEMNTRRVAD